MASSSYSTPLISLDGVVIDCETTGLDAANARLIQIGAARIVSGRLDPGSRLELLVNPGIPIPKETSAIHGLTDVHVERAAPAGDVLPLLEKFIGQDILIGHNIGYDLAVLRREYERAGKPWHAPRALDVRMLARLAAPTLAHYGLKQLCEWLGLRDDTGGSAADDAATTARVFEALLPLLRKRDIRTIAEAETASRRLAETEVGETMGLPPRAAGGADTAQPLARIDSFPYRHRVREVMSSPPVIAPAETTVRQALALLLERKVSSVYVTDARGEHSIVTERDLLRALQSSDTAAFELPLGAIAVKPLQTISEEAFIYRAIGRMDRLGIRHLAVRSARGEIVGAVTPRNLLHQRATAAIMLGDEIDSAPDAATLGRAWGGLARMTRALIDEDVDARIVSQVISSEICVLTRRATQLAAESMAADGWGEAPVPYAVLVLGSAGRGESLLAADQDNAIVFEAGEPGGTADKWFEELGARMAEILDTVGVPYCKGGVMAKNPLWRHSVDGWKQVIDGWVGRHKTEDLLNVDIFFDGTAVHGDTGLGDLVWNYAYDAGHRAPEFLKLMAESTRKLQAPFGLFGGIKTGPDGRADLKLGGLLPIFTAARVLSIRHNVRGRSTPDRLCALAAKGLGSATDIVDLVEAHRTILGAMLVQQIADTEAGVPLTSKVDPARLGGDGRTRLKKALDKVSIAVDLVNEGRV